MRNLSRNIGMFMLKDAAGLESDALMKTVLSVREYKQGIMFS